MKIFIIMAAVVLVLAPRQCAEEDEETDKENPIENSDYVAKDVSARIAIAEWHDFIKESDSIILSATKQISSAVDMTDDAKLKHKFKFKNDIYLADGKLERLSEKLLWAKRLERKNGII